MGFSPFLFPAQILLTNSWGSFIYALLQECPGEI